MHSEAGGMQGRSRSEVSEIESYELWLGVAFTKAYLLRIGMCNTLTRDSCKSKESIQHFLCLCLQYDVERELLWTALNRLYSRPFSETNLGAWLCASLAQKAASELLEYT